MGGLDVVKPDEDSVRVGGEWWHVRISLQIYTGTGLVRHVGQVSQLYKHQHSHLSHTRMAQLRAGRIHDGRIWNAQTDEWLI